MGILRKISLFAVVLFAPLLIITSVGAAQTRDARSNVSTSQSTLPTTPIGVHPDGTPTGCPSGNICSYQDQNGGPGGDSYCFYRDVDVTDWTSITCASGSGDGSDTDSLVNTHTSGDQLLYEGTSYTGQEACIAYGSYYDDLGDNGYPNGDLLHNNISSSEQSSGTCAGAPA